MSSSQKVWFTSKPLRANAEHFEFYTSGKSKADIKQNFNEQISICSERKVRHIPNFYFYIAFKAFALLTTYFEGVFGFGDTSGECSDSSWVCT